MVTKEIVNRFLTYDKQTGGLTWNTTTPDMFEDGVRTKIMKSRMFNARYSGKPAFTAVNGHGYKAGVIRGARTTAHRVIWLMVHGEFPDQIDHINGDRTDNRLSNLRNVTKRENGRNLAVSSRNTSGVVGVRYQRSRGRWCADIRVDGKLLFLGRYKTKLEAVAARHAAEITHGFHPNHGKR